LLCSNIGLPIMLDWLQEYFAELSEAYWGKNDFYPFTRSELLQHDPLGYEAVKRAWHEQCGNDVDEYPPHSQPEL
jgi:hypothetical protein